jgi:hypothetical protein
MNLHEQKCEDIIYLFGENFPRFDDGYHIVSFSWWVLSNNIQRNIDEKIYLYEFN